MAIKKPVVAVGTFLVASSSDKNDTRWRNPTLLRLQDLKLKPGDWIGMRAFGQWKPGDGYGWMSSLAAAFMSGPATTLPPWKGIPLPSAGIPINNWPDGKPTRGENCFNVPAERTLITRIPKGTTMIGLTSPDAFWCDNSSNGYLVRITRPNLSGAGILTEEVDSTTEDAEGFCNCSNGPDDLLVDACADEEDDFLSSRALVWSKSPVLDEGSAPFLPQWRGWYQTRFAPEASVFSRKAVPPRKDIHLGWDVFCPGGTPLISPVTPCVVDLIGDDFKGWGRAILLRAQVDSEPFRFVYAHLDKILVVGGDRITDPSRIIGLSGCSGNGKDPSCGQDGRTDARLDHVHVEVQRRQKDPTDGKLKWVPIDPATLLGRSWSLVSPQ